MPLEKETTIINIHNDASGIVISKLDEIISLINQNQKLIMNELDDLTTEVAETKGIMASAKVLIEGFAAALAKAGTDPAKLAALKADLDSGSTELADAISKNPLPTEVVVTPPTE